MTIENNAFKLLIVSFLFITALSFGRLAFAQEGVRNGQTNLSNPEEPGSGPIIERSNETAVTTSTDTNNLWAVNMMWLLPLIAIPVLVFLVWPKRKKDSMDLSVGYSGAKGGRAKRNDEDLEDDDLF